MQKTFKKGQKSSIKTKLVQINTISSFASTNFLNKHQNNLLTKQKHYKVQKKLKKIRKVQIKQNKFNMIQLVPLLVQIF